MTRIKDLKSEMSYFERIEAAKLTFMAENIRFNFLGTGGGTANIYNNRDDDLLLIIHFTQEANPANFGSSFRLTNVHNGKNATLYQWNANSGDHTFYMIIQKGDVVTLTSAGIVNQGLAQWYVVPF